MQVRRSTKKSTQYKSITLSVRTPVPHPKYAGPKAYEVKKTKADPVLYDTNVEAAQKIERTPARALALAAIAMAKAANPYGVRAMSGKQAAYNVVGCCRAWAKKNHQSFNKYFGKALANIA